MKRTVYVVVGVIVLCGVLAFTLLMQPGPRDSAQAVSKAIEFCDGLSEPDALLMLDVMHRRFGIESFGDAVQRYDQILAELPESDTAHLRVFRRIADPENPLHEEDWQELVADLDFFIIPALYCDRLGLPYGYSQTLIQKANEGGLQLTHVLLACIWVKENGCEEVLPQGFMKEVARATDGLINNDSVVTEVELEAAAFLHLAGQGALVERSFVDRVIAVQNSDGGWPASSASGESSYWHSTILGLLLLLHVENPSSSYPPMLAASST